MTEGAEYERPGVPEPAGSSAEPPRRRWLRLTLFIAGPALLMVLAVAWYLRGGRTVSTDDAFVQQDIVQISTDVAGTVAAVLVRDDQRVHAGQELYRLDDEPFRIALAGAEAQLAQIGNDVAQAQATYRERQQDIAQADTDVAFNRRELARLTHLGPGAVVTQEQIDAARHTLDTSVTRAASLREEAAAALAALDGDAGLPLERRARYRAALAQRDQARWNLERTRVRAPGDGVVTRVANVRPGEYLQPSVPAFALVETAHVWVEANPKETDLTWLRPGQRARMQVDAYPRRTWQAEVEAVSPATGAQFALLPPQNASGNWVKVVQRVPVRLRIELPPDAPPLRAGMSAHVSIDTGHRRHLGDLGRAVGSWVGLG